MLEILACYYAIINLLLFILMGVDKYKAVKNKWRISEQQLLTLCFFGACIGLSIGMKVFRHKIRKKKFYIVLILSTMLHSYVIFRVLSI